MSSITGSCSASTSQTLFTSHIQELQEQRLEERREMERVAEEKKMEEATRSTNMLEPNKGQLLDVFV